MSKITQYFNSVEELNAYYKNGVPSTVLAVVKGENGGSDILYTSENNSPWNPGTNEEMGGWPEDYEETKEELDEATLWSFWISEEPGPVNGYQSIGDFDDIVNNMPEYDDEENYEMTTDVFHDAINDGTLYIEVEGYEEFPVYADIISSNSIEVNNPQDWYHAGDEKLRLFAIVDGKKYVYNWDAENISLYSADMDDHVVNNGYVSVVEGEEDWLVLHNVYFEATSLSTETDAESGDAVFIQGEFVVRGEDFEIAEDDEE